MILVTATYVKDKYGVPIAELARWRRLDIGPAYYRLGDRLIRYDIGDVDDWFHDLANAHLHDFPVQECASPCLV